MFLRPHTLANPTLVHGNRHGGAHSGAIGSVRRFRALININAGALGYDVVLKLLYSERSMLKAALIGCMALLAVLANNLVAQGKVDCDTHYKSTLERLRRMHLPADRTVALTRQALRIYDACQTGDFEDAVSFFEQLDRWKN